MALLVLLNNFMHDFSAAGWLFCSVMLWVALRDYNSEKRVGKPVAVLLNNVLLLMRISLAGIVLFGLFRLLAYREYEWSEAAGDSQVVLLVVKHILLTGIFIFGVIFYRRTSRIVKKELG